MGWAPFGPSNRVRAPEGDGDTLGRILAANRHRVVRGRPLPVDAVPARGLVVVTCMDARVDPLPALGLRPGDAHVVRNAGAMVTDDVLRSLALSHAITGTREALLIAHTECGAFETTDAAVAGVREGAGRILATGGLPEDYRVHQLLLDVRSGTLRPLGPT